MTQTTDERINHDENATAAIASTGDRMIGNTSGATAAITALAGDTAVRDAAAAGTRLIALWPLADAMQLDNDAKYAENLQVRATRMIARVTTGLDVTVPDAEFVYEGADEIPGRPQEIVDALLAANDAYDTMADHAAALAGAVGVAAAGAGVAGAADVADSTTEAAAADGAATAAADAIVAAGYDALCDTADAMGAGWTDDVADAIHAALAAAVPAVLSTLTADAAADTADDAGEAVAGFSETTDVADAAKPSGADDSAAAVDGADGADGADGVDGAGGVDGVDGADGADGVDGPETAALTRRFAAALGICDALLTAVEHTAGNDADDVNGIAAAGLPVLLFVNELRETLGVPRICLDEDDYRTLLAARATARAAATNPTFTATARIIAPLAAAEWARHYEDVLWDPEEAKKRAKEEDERKNKEALAAKFAHVKDDPTKPAVEL